MNRQARRVLLIDDDHDLRAVLQDLLLEEGYEVTGAPSLEAGIPLVEHGLFQLIVTDSFRRLDQDPLAAVEELPLLAQPLQVGLMTAWPVSEEAVHQRGFAFLLKKPFELEDFLSTLADCLSRVEDHL